MVNAYLDNVRAALSCVTPTYIQVSDYNTALGSLQQLLLNRGQALPLRGGSPPIALLVRQFFKLIEDKEAVAARERWRLTIASYDYALREPQTHAPLLSFHWHPEPLILEGGRSVSFPHLHIGSSILSERSISKMHLPTERIAFEDVVRLAIEEFDISPLRVDWRAILTRTRREFEQHRTWPTSGGHR